MKIIEDNIKTVTDQIETDFLINLVLAKKKINGLDPYIKELSKIYVFIKIANLGRAKPNISEMMKYLDMSKSKLSKSVSELENIGLIKNIKFDRVKLLEVLSLFSAIEYIDSHKK